MEGRRGTGETPEKTLKWRDGMLPKKYLWETNRSQRDIGEYICFAWECPCQPIEFVVFSEAIRHPGKSSKYRVALCQKHLRRYRYTGKMPRRRQWDKLVFKRMP